MTLRLVELHRSLPYCPKTNSSLPRVADRVAHCLEPAQVQRLAGRTAGDHRDRAHLLGERDQDLGGVVVDVRRRRVLDDRGQRAVEVQPDDRVGGGPDERGVLLLALDRAELHGPTPPHDGITAHSPRGASTVGGWLDVSHSPWLRTLLTAAGGTAAAAVDDPPTLGTPTITATSAASVSVSVSVDSHNSDTTVQVEYVTAGAYRAHRVPGAATTVTIGTTPASDAGPAVVTGQVTGLTPGSTYRMRVKAVNAGGQTASADVNVSTPKAPKIAFRAKVGPNTTKLTKLSCPAWSASAARRSGSSAGRSPRAARSPPKPTPRSGTDAAADLALQEPPLRPGAKVSRSECSQRARRSRPSP